MSTNVDLKHPSYNKMLTSWEMMYDVCVSERWIQSKGTDYLPKLDQMTDAQYLAYVRRAEFPLFTRHALDSFVGMSMRKDLLIEGIDREHEFFKNVDSKGTDIKAYAEKLVKSFLQYRRCGTLVEMPVADPDQSKADAEKENVKVRFAFYDHLSIINWKTETDNNLTKLVLVVLEEEVDTATDEFSHETKSRYRVLKLENGRYHQEIYDHEKKLIGILTPQMNGDFLDYIPFVIHGGVPIVSPTLLPIAEQNIHWYMKDADYQHGLHYTALPTPWIVGVDPKDENTPKTIGPQKLWILPIGASCGMLEFNGAGLGQVQLSLEGTFGNITLLSSQILVPKSAYDESATSSSIRSASETASLSSMVNSLSEELTQAVEWASEWGGFAAEGTKVEINSDFIPMTLSGADVSAYVSAVLKEGFSKRTLFDLLKRGDIIEGDRQYEEEMKAIEEEAKERQDAEVELAERLAKVEAKLDLIAQKAAANDPNKQSPDSKQKDGQDGATPAEKDGQK